jgi:hypothetical protein
MKDDFQLKFKNFMKRIAKHAASFRTGIKNNETCETGCFAQREISRNGQFVSRNNETRFASSFTKLDVIAVEFAVAGRTEIYGLLSARYLHTYSSS